MIVFTSGLKSLLESGVDPNSLSENLSGHLVDLLGLFDGKSKDKAPLNELEMSVVRSLERVVDDIDSGRLAHALSTLANGIDEGWWTGPLCAAIAMAAHFTCTGEPEGDISMTTDKALVMMTSALTIVKTDGNHTRRI